MRAAPRRRLPRGLVPPTGRRLVVDDGHFPPLSGRNNAGDPWRGTSRIVDPAARRRRNRRTWRELKAEGRRAHVAALANARADAIADQGPTS